MSSGERQAALHAVMDLSDVILMTEVGCALRKKHHYFLTTSDPRLMHDYEFMNLRNPYSLLVFCGSA
jgi:hypothetical protein